MLFSIARIVGQTARAYVRKKSNLYIYIYVAEKYVFISAFSGVVFFFVFRSIFHDINI